MFVGIYLRTLYLAISNLPQIAVLQDLNVSKYVNTNLMIFIPLFLFFHSVGENSTGHKQSYKKDTKIKKKPLVEICLTNIDIPQQKLIL